MLNLFYTSGIASVIKLIIAMQEGVIPANLHYHNPNPAIEPLLDGRVKVVTENTRWRGKYTALCNNGFGGSYSHLILQQVEEVERRNQNHDAFAQRLLTFAGRTRDLVAEGLEFARERGDDLEMQALMQGVASAEISSYPYRGYTITNKANSDIEVEVCSVDDTPHKIQLCLLSTWMSF